MTEEGPQGTVATPQVAGATNGKRGNGRRRRRNGRNGAQGKPQPVANGNTQPMAVTTTTPTVTVTNHDPTTLAATNLLQVHSTPSTVSNDQTPKRTNQRRRKRGPNTKQPGNEVNGPREETGATTEPSTPLVTEPDANGNNNNAAQNRRRNRQNKKKVAPATNNPVASNAQESVTTEPSITVVTDPDTTNGNNNNNKNQEGRKARQNKKKVAPATAASNAQESNGDAGAKNLPEVANPDGAVPTVNSKGTPQENRANKRRNRKRNVAKEGNPTPDGKQDVAVESEGITAPANAATNGKRGKKGPRPGPGLVSLDPTTTLVRPSLRVRMASAESNPYNKPLSSDDVILVPDFFGKEDDWSLYNTLVEEFGQLQKDGINGAKLKPLYQGAHMVATNPKVSKTFQEVVNKLCQYFQIKQSSTRLDWYRDSKDWKPFHHDSAAYNKNHAQRHNIAVMASFGASREFAFLKSDVGESVEIESKPDTRCRIYLPQPNNCCISFGQDVNLHFKHAINALADNQQDGKGHISVLVWGWSDSIGKENNETSQPETKENEATAPPEPQRARRNLRRNNVRNRRKKQAAQGNDAPPEEKNA